MNPHAIALFMATARRTARSAALCCSAADRRIRPPGTTGEASAVSSTLLERARPIPDVLATSEDPVLKRKLERVLANREYASRELALPDDRSYRTYTDLGRRFVLWNVFAAPELSLEPRQWCFLIAGCVSYRGYFDEAAARTEASRFPRPAMTFMSAACLHSTLGYFNDPMLSSVIRYTDTEVARLILHELAHQVAYAEGRTVFNRSLP